MRAALHRLYLEVTRFVGDAALHLYEEEMLAQPLLEEIYSHTELLAIAERARASVSPEEQQLFTGFVSLSFAERQQAA